MRSAVCGHVVSMGNRYDGITRGTLFLLIKPAFCNNLRIHAKAFLGATWRIRMAVCHVGNAIKPKSRETLLSWTDCTSPVRINDSMVVTIRICNYVFISKFQSSYHSPSRHGDNKLQNRPNLISKAPLAMLLQNSIQNMAK